MCNSIFGKGQQVVGAGKEWGCQVAYFPSSSIRWLSFSVEVWASMVSTNNMHKSAHKVHLSIPVLSFPNIFLA
jgi:hypothetical protein